MLLALFCGRKNVNRIQIEAEQDQFQVQSFLGTYNKNIVLKEKRNACFTVDALDLQ